MLTLSIVLLCAAVYRLTRLAGIDQFPFGPLRDRLEAVVDQAADDERTGRRATRTQRTAAWLYEMVTCPWCASGWLAIGGAVVWQHAVGPDPWWFWAPAAACTASAFTGAATYVVSLLAGFAERHGD